MAGIVYHRNQIDQITIESYEAFFNQMNQNGVDMDGYYGLQCWDGCDVLWEKLGYYLITQPQGNGHAYQCWTVSRDANTHPPTITQIPNLNDVKRGDIVVYAPGGGIGSDGHIGFAHEDYNGGSTILSFGQNQAGGVPYATGGRFFNLSPTSVSNFLGAFRYDAWQQPIPPHPPTPVTKTTNFKRHFPWPIAWKNWTNFKR